MLVFFTALYITAPETTVDADVGLSCKASKASLYRLDSIFIRVASSQDKQSIGHTVFRLRPPRRAGSGQVRSGRYKLAFIKP